MDYEELLQRTREKAYVTLIKMCEEDDMAPEIKLQAVAMLLAATERDQFLLQDVGGNDNSGVELSVVDD